MGQVGPLCEHHLPQCLSTKNLKRVVHPLIWSTSMSTHPPMFLTMLALQSQSVLKTQGWNFITAFGISCLSEKGPGVILPFGEVLNKASSCFHLIRTPTPFSKYCLQQTRSTPKPAPLTPQAQLCINTLGKLPSIHLPMPPSPKSGQLSYFQPHCRDTHQQKSNYKK